MITLCMDTSHIDLALAIIKDDEIVASVQKPCFKRQSEEFFPELERIMSEAQLEPEDIDQVVVSKGPGSYTGIRIAMTAAKVFCSTRDLPLATIGTLDLYGACHPNCAVLMDARGKRAYIAEYRDGKCVREPQAMYLEEIEPLLDPSLEIIGDAHLLNREDIAPDIANCFLASRNQWEFAENVDLVTPEYLKSAEAYKVGK